MGGQAHDGLGAEGAKTDHSLCHRPSRGRLVARPPPLAAKRTCPPTTTASACPQLEVTADLAERRRIRSAIRELQRQELEREEEALASKRFRAERQDNKENWLQ